MFGKYTDYGPILLRIRSIEIILDHVNGPIFSSEAENTWTS